MSDAPKCSYGESLLRQYLEIMVPDLERIYNYRPAWLMGLEIDIYFPQARVGVEFNGDQHYIPTESFGHPKSQMQRDRKKRRLCCENDVVLLTVAAIGLEWTKLNPVRRRIVEGAHKHSGLPEMQRMPKDKQSIEFRKWRSAYAKEANKLRPLNRLSKAYREKLIELYDSPTARIKNKRPGREAYRKAWEAYERKPNAGIEVPDARSSMTPVGGRKAGPIPPGDIVLE